MQRIFVTGMGIISAIGRSVAANRLSLQGGVGGVAQDRPFVAGGGAWPVGRVLPDDEALRKELGVDEPGVTRTSLLALHAFLEAVEDAGITPAELSSEATALIAGTTVGGMCEADQLYRDVTDRDAQSPYLASYDCSSVLLFLQRRYGLKGVLDTINTACSSSANAITYGARLIRQGMADRVIVGGVDSLSRFTVNGFGSLRILSPEVCAPFDAGRQGLNLGEGAAFLVLEGEDKLPAGKKVWGELRGFHNTSDAFHPTSLSPDGDGPFLAMEGALISAGLHAAEIDHINAHGTGTENNDEVESRAMIRVFDEPPPFVSTKSYTGHTLGAAAAVEAVYSLLSLRHQEMYPGLRFSTPIAGTQLRPVARYQEATLRHVMSNSFGFGGNCASLIFSKT